MERITGKKPTECPACAGIGYTEHTAPDIQKLDGRLLTVKRGSGCATCLGTGQLPNPNPR